MTTEWSQNQSGFSLIEALIALAIFSMVAVVVVRAMPGTAQNLARADAAQSKLSQAQMILERGIRGPGCWQETAETDGLMLVWDLSRQISGEYGLFSVSVVAPDTINRPVLQTQTIKRLSCA